MPEIGPTFQDASQIGAKALLCFIDKYVSLEFPSVMHVTMSKFLTFSSLCLRFIAAVKNLRLNENRYLNSHQTKLMHTAVDHVSLRHIWFLIA